MLDSQNLPGEIRLDRGGDALGLCHVERVGAYLPHSSPGILGGPIADCESNFQTYSFNLTRHRIVYAAAGKEWDGSDARTVDIAIGLASYVGCAVVEARPHGDAAVRPSCPSLRDRVDVIRDHWTLRIHDGTYERNEDVRAVGGMNLRFFRHFAATEQRYSGTPCV